MKESLNIIQILRDRSLLGEFIQDQSTWTAWRTFLRCFFGLRQVKGDKELYEACTSRSQWPDKAFQEGWCVVGRRGGKSRMAAFMGVYLSVFKKYKLAPGERGILLIISVSKEQAAIIKAISAIFLTKTYSLKAWFNGKTNGPLT